MSSVKNDKLHLIENCEFLLDKPLPNRKNRSLESINLKTLKKDKKIEKKELVLGVPDKIKDGKELVKVIPDKIESGKDLVKFIPGKIKDKDGKEQPYSSLGVSSTSIHVGPSSAEERQRTGRYLAVGLTLIMLFIAFYHTVMRQTPVLAGLLPPAIIMIIYILWLLYFAKKRKRIEITAV